MGGIFWRILIAVLFVALIFALIPPLVAFAGIGVDANLITIVRICIIAIAIFYIIKGYPFPPPA